MVASQLHNQKRVVALSTPGMTDPLIIRDVMGSTVEDAIQQAVHSSAADPRKVQQLSQEISGGRWDVIQRNSSGRLQKIDRKSRIGEAPGEVIELEIHRYLEVGSINAI